MPNMSAADLAKRKNVRAGHRGSATKIIGRADELLSSGRPDMDKLSQVKLTLKEKVEVLNCLDGEILDMVKEEEVAGEIEQSDEFKEGIHSILVRIERVLTPARTAPAATVPDPTSVSRPHTTSGSHVKLPKLTIQPFSGELTEWTPFWEFYHSAIHDNPGLTEVEKFNYLQSLLERTALDAISGLSLTVSNYKEAVSVLEK